MAKKGQENVWDELKGVKAGLKDEVVIKMGEKEIILPIKFVEITDIREINEEYEDMKPEKPLVKVPVKGNKIQIRVPSEQEKYKAFNNHEKAQEWQQKIQPIEEERRARLAYEFIEDGHKPGESKKEGIKIIKERLREIDRLDIINKGFELNGMSDRLDEAAKNS